MRFKQRAQQYRWQFLGGLYLLVFCGILLLAYRGELPGFLTQNDKLAHLILYAIATFVGHQAFKQRTIWGKIPFFPGLFSLFTIGEEFAQSFSPNRTFDSGDLVASFFGIAIGWGLAQKVTGKNSIKNSTKK
jgi:VanZ family protein